MCTTEIKNSVQVRFPASMKLILQPQLLFMQDVSRFFSDCSYLLKQTTEEDTSVSFLLIQPGWFHHLENKFLFL